MINRCTKCSECDTQRKCDRVNNMAGNKMINGPIRQNEYDEYNKCKEFANCKKRIGWSYRVVVISGCLMEERLFDDCSKAQEEYYYSLSVFRINYNAGTIENFYIILEKYVYQGMSDEKEQGIIEMFHTIGYKPVNLVDIY